MVIITIDTTRDTVAEIERTIRYLQQYLEGAPTPKAEPVRDLLGMEIFTQSKEAAAPAEEQKGAEKIDAATILKEAERKISEKKPSKPSKEESTVVEDDDRDAFIEIVEYD